MGWGTTFNCEIFLSKENITSKEQLESLVEDKKLLLTEIKQKLAMFASANPRDIVPKEWEDESINYLNNNIQELVEDFTNIHLQLVNYKYCLANYSTIRND